MKIQALHVPSRSGIKPSAIRPLLLALIARKQTAALGVLAALFMITPVHAAARYWDGGNADIAANGDGNSDGATGTWSTGIENWDQGSGLPHVAWVNGSDVATIDGVSQTLTLGANIVLGGIIQKSGGSSIAIGGGGYTLTLNITGANTFQGAANATTGRTLTVNAVIEGAVGKNLVIAGPATSGTGTINLGSANTFSGTTSFSAGATSGARVVLNNRLALQNSTVTLSSDANLVFNDSVATNTFTFGGLAASSAGTGSNLALRNDASTPIAIALTVGGNNQSTTYNGVLSGDGSLIKTGSGTLTLGGANTYTGTTTVSSGTLQVNGSTTSPTSVNNGATLAGSGLVNAAVTVAAGGFIKAPDSNLTVSSLAFSGMGTLSVGTLSSYTSTAALSVTDALDLSGGAGAVTLNLPTALGFNGTYHLIRFGSGPANANGFTLGTVPTLAWNQTASLQVNGNYLDYVITAAGDTTAPTLSSTLPANNATNVLAGADLVATFDETIVAGTGSIELRRTSDAALIESFIVASSPRLVFSTTQLIIQPTSVLPTGTYYVIIPVGAIKDTSGNNYAGIISNTGWKFTVPIPPVLFTDTGSPANPPWSAVLPTLNVDSPDPGPVYGSVINVNNAAVQVGLYGNRPISVTSQRIHVACNTSTTNFADFTRWFQTDGNTHVLRIFVDDENTATSRAGTSSHTEAFNGGGWDYADNMTHEWTGHYTGAQIRQGSTSFQLMNSDNEWAFHLNLASNGTVNINNRNGTDRLVTNPDGSAKVFGSSGFDVRVLDDGLNYRVFVDGVLYTSSSYSRPTGTTNFRWGMYFGADNLNPPADFNIIMVSGAQIKSWPGRLTDATTTITKANNTTNLDSGASWVGGVDPGIHNQAVWNSTVLAANTTTLASYQQWAGLKIVDPGGTVTINGSATLGLDDAGVDMSSPAMKNLDVNCPVQMTAPHIWDVAAGRTATFDGIVSGYPGITKNGGGTVRLNAANTYSGDTTLSDGTLVANNNSALGGGLLVFNGGNLSNTASCTLGNDVNLNSNASVSVAASQSLTLNGSIAGTGLLTKGDTGTLKLSGANTYTGATIVSAGTLAVGNTSALLPTSSLTLAGGTVLQPNLDGVVIDAPITVGASGTTATISAPTNNPGGAFVSTLTLKSVLTGSGNVTFSSSVNQNAFSTVYLGAQSTYAGSTLLDTAGTTATQIIVKLGIPNALPTTTVLTIDGQTGAGTGRYAELNLNGFNQQIAGLTNTARSLRFQRVVNSDISAAATLTINNSSNHTFSGTLGGGANGSVAAAAMPGSTNGNNFGLTKSGGGTFTLASAPGTNTFTGAVAINAGVLKLGAASQIADAIASFTINGGTFDVATFSEGITPAATLTNGTLAGTGWLLARGGYACSGTNTISAGLTVRSSDTNSGLFNISSGTTTVSGVIFSDNSTLQGITKTGSGTLTLTGANTYSGNTTVNGGTLSLGTNNTSNNASTVTLATSAALLKLNFAGTETVAKLFIGTSQKPAGTYGHSSTGATNGGLGVGALDAWFAAGTGTLTVTSSPPATGYAAWKSTNAPTGTPGDDFDVDGVTNGIEYVLGGNASTNDLAKLPAISTSGGNLVFSFIRAQASIDGTTTVVIQVGTDLGAWPDSYLVPTTAVANNPGVTVVNDLPVAGFDTVTLTLPYSSAEKKFVRLKVVP